jgi:hypothetical protein
VGLEGAAVEDVYLGDEEVETVTLDGLLDRFGAPGFIKLDIEGGEVEALRAAERLLATKPIILCELHGDAARELVVGHLRAAGYEVKFEDPDHILAR